MKELSSLQRQTLARVVRATAAAAWYRAEGSGERVTLASLHSRGILIRRVWKENKAAAACGAYSSPAHEYQAAGLVMQVMREMYPSLGKATAPHPESLPNCGKHGFCHLPAGHKDECLGHLQIEKNETR